MASFTIKTHCPNCGEVSLTPADIELRVDNASNPGPNSCYTFTCPGCLSPVRKQADQRIVSSLVTAGVPALGLLTDQPTSDLTPVGVPTLTRDDLSPLSEALVVSHDDLIDTHFLLRDDKWLEEVLDEFAQQMRSRPKQ